jgi:hypothetical protein
MRARAALRRHVYESTERIPAQTRAGPSSSWARWSAAWPSSHHPRGRPRQGPLGPQQLHGLPHDPRRGRLLRPRAHAGVPPARARTSSARCCATRRRCIPGQRRMQNYHFTRQIDDLVAFLQWIDGMDLNGFPPPPRSTPWPRRAPPRRSRRPTTARRCSTSSAWRVTRSAGRAAPWARARPRRRRASTPRTSSAGCKTPGRQARHRDAAAPLTDAQVRELVAFLSQLRPEVRP